MSLYFVLATDCYLKCSQSKISFISDTLFHSLRTNDKQDNKPKYWDQWCDIHSINQLINQSINQSINQNH